MRNSEGGKRPEQIRSLGGKFPRHYSPPVVPHQMHRPQAGDRDELNDVPGQFRGAVGETRAGSGPWRVAALVGRDGAVAACVQECSDRPPRARVLWESMQENHGSPVARSRVTHVEDKPCPCEAGDTSDAHRSPFHAARAAMTVVYKLDHGTDTV